MSHSVYHTAFYFSFAFTYIYMKQAHFVHSRDTIAAAIRYVKWIIFLRLLYLPLAIFYMNATDSLAHTHTHTQTVTLIHKRVAQNSIFFFLRSLRSPLPCFPHELYLFCGGNDRRGKIQGWLRSRLYIYISPCCVWLCARVHHRCAVCYSVRFCCYRCCSWFCVHVLES